MYNIEKYRSLRRYFINVLSYEQIFKPVLSWEVKKGRKEIDLVISKFPIKGSMLVRNDQLYFNMTKDEILRWRYKMQIENSDKLEKLIIG